MVFSYLSLSLSLCFILSTLLLTPLSLSLAVRIKLDSTMVRTGLAKNLLKSVQNVSTHFESGQPNAKKTICSEEV